MLAALALTLFVYQTGLWGSWLFDDYPNIVQNPGVHLTRIDLASLTHAALSSPSSIFKRPLASLTFAANYYFSGLNPFSWKLTNLFIHLLNGILAFLVARVLLTQTRKSVTDPAQSPTPTETKYIGVVAACIAAAWMLLPINLTGVLYVVQRMESLANIFVLAGLLGYITGRRRMLSISGSPRTRHSGLLLSATSLVLATAAGLTAKETAVMLPLYAFLIEWIVFGFRMPPQRADRLDTSHGNTETSCQNRTDRSVLALFALVLVVPMIVGLIWLYPGVLSQASWAARDFDLQTRLLSEARIVVGYIAWTLLALPHWLSFYHDNFQVSTSLFHPWTTLASILVLLALVLAVFKFRRTHPLFALGIALYLGCHVLTATIIPLELIYEHRNYFASFGLMLALVPLFAVPSSARLARVRWGVLGAALLTWTVLTASTAYAWGDSMRLARELAARAPNSPRAQYELGRGYIIASHYEPDSPYTPLVYAPLERASKLPDSSILPQQALIFFNARMHRPVKVEWWDSLIATLKRRKPGVQDESSLAALTQCARNGLCSLPAHRMQQAFQAAVSYPDTDARLWASYGDYTWNVLGNHAEGLKLTQHAVNADPSEPAYRITLVRMYLVLNKLSEAEQQINALKHMNIGGELDDSIANLHQRLSSARCNEASCTETSHEQSQP
ncbi:hypothetical protein [Oleiagrimonas sp. MCCC 1A03011]|uniref:hypothetical protein n=1 Tax=Oleiagrimonas sp. MCCC 1A03011 TaxID=1926883 RepID=UPI001F0B9380|nr:hypothetical protein [Oleiagrimonas sp. MCCC 1A03011]